MGRLILGVMLLLGFAIKLHETEILYIVELLGGLYLFFDGFKLLNTQEDK